MSARDARHLPHGFTLLELVLVLLILSVALAAVASSLHGWSRGAKVRDASEQFLAVTRWARTQAISQATTYRLNVDPRNNTYFLTQQDGQQFVNVRNDFGQVFGVPDGFRIVMTDDQQQPLEAVDFLPTGRARTARVRIEHPQDGDGITLECLSPAEGFRVATSAANATAAQGAMR